VVAPLKMWGYEQNKPQKKRGGPDPILYRAQKRSWELSKWGESRKRVWRSKEKIKTALQRQCNEIFQNKTEANVGGWPAKKKGGRPAGKTRTKRKSRVQTRPSRTRRDFSESRMKQK